jgi:hypothetical protein
MRPNGLIERRKAARVTETTKQFVIILLVVTAVLLVVSAFSFFLYELFVGQAHVDASVSASLNAFLVAMLTLAGIVINGMVSRRHYEQLNRTTQNIVHEESADLKDKLANGFGTRIGQVAAQQVTETVLPVALANRDAIQQLQATTSEAHTAATDANTAALTANTDVTSDLASKFKAP